MAMRNQGFSDERLASANCLNGKSWGKSWSKQVGMLLALGWVAGVSSLPVMASSRTPQERLPFQISQIPVSAKVLYVNPVLGSDMPGAGESAGAAYRTITYALQQAQGITVIQLAPGSYSRQTGEVFPLTLQPGVILRGDESNQGQTVLVVGGGDYVSPTFAKQSVTIRAENDSEVRGLTITNPNTRGTGVWIESANPTISKNTFANSLRDGIFVTGTAKPKIEANVFIKNDGNGISVARAAAGEIRNNLFQDTGFGIAVGGTSTPLIEGNQILQNQVGIVVSNAARPVLRNNLIEGNLRDGIVAIAESQPNLGTIDNPGNNVLRNNTRYDVYNATTAGKNIVIPAYGNSINAQQILGAVDFTAAQVTPPDSPVAASKFRDVQGHWAQAYIEALTARNIITGFPDGTYRPAEPVTRAQFAAIITKAFAPTAQRSSFEFKDIPTNFWAYGAIQSAYQGKFMVGYPGQLFMPGQQIPRVQVLVSLANGLGFSADKPSVLSLYQDAAQIPAYALNPVVAATQRQIVVNHPNLKEITPNREATRAEVAAFVYQALVNAGRAELIPSPYLVMAPQ